MHEELDVPAPELLIQHRLVREVRFDQADLADRRPIPLREVVDDGDILPPFGQHANDMAADVSGTARDQNRSHRLPLSVKTARAC